MGVQKNLGEIKKKLEDIKKLLEKTPPDVAGAKKALGPIKVLSNDTLNLMMKRKKDGDEGLKKLGETCNDMLKVIQSGGYDLKKMTTAYKAATAAADAVEKVLDPARH